MEYDKLRCVCVGREECSNISEMVDFEYFLSFGSNFGQVKAWITLNFADIVNFVSFNLVLSCFLSMILGSEHSALVYLKWCCFRVLFHFGPFSQYLGWFRASSMLNKICWARISFFVFVSMEIFYT